MSNLETMTKEDIIFKTNAFLIDEFEVDEDDISSDADLKETLELDSLDYVDLVVSVESNFNVKLDADDFTDIVTLQNFYDLLERKLK